MYTVYSPGKRPKEEMLTSIRILRISYALGLGYPRPRQFDNKLHILPPKECPKSLVVFLLGSRIEQSAIFSRVVIYTQWMMRLQRAFWMLQLVHSVRNYWVSGFPGLPKTLLETNLSTRISAGNPVKIKFLECLDWFSASIRKAWKSFGNPILQGWLSKRKPHNFL